MAKRKTMKGVTCSKRKGVVYWYARINGEKRYCGKDDKGKNLAEAAKAKDISRKYENKEINAGLRVKKIEFKTVKDLANWYMTLPSTQELKSYNRKLSLCAHLLKYFGNRQINQVEGDDQEHYREYRRGQGAKDGTIDLEIGLLSTIYHSALKKKKINADSMPGEFVLKCNSVPRRSVTKEEFKGLLKYASDDFKDLLVCGYESAMRLNEICKLTASQIHLDVQHILGKMLDYIDLGIFDTKTGARRTVPVSARLKEVLKRRLKGLGPDDYVFTNKGKKYYKVLIAITMKAVCEKANIIYGDKPVNKKGERAGIVFHCLRHTRTSRWIEKGFSDEIVRRATGHKTLRAYQKYVKLDPRVVMKLVEDKKPKREKNGTKSSQSL